jgi:MarR family 2-MHQ and catechol resistance regulon transcriptional repressor
MMTNVLRLYRLIHDIYVLLDDGDRRTLDQFGLTISQYGLLMQLRGNGSGMRLTTLSERLLLAKSTITRAVDQLEDGGLVERIVDPDDRRAQRVVLTGQGLDICNKAHAAHRASLEYRLAHIDSHTRENLDHLLTQLRSNLRADLGQRDDPSYPQDTSSNSITGEHG